MSKTDPYQFHNLASTKAHKEKLQELSRALDSWIQATGDAKPRIPRADREDVYGHVLSDRWKIKTEEPGASKGAMHINATGPILTVSHK